jgi:hypothetical protein
VYGQEDGPDEIQNHVYQRERSVRLIRLVGSYGNSKLGLKLKLFSG